MNGRESGETGDREVGQEELPRYFLALGMAVVLEVPVAVLRGGTG